MQDIRAITLDLDDTLWEIRPVIARAEKRLYEWFGEHYPRIVERFSMGDAVAVRSEVLRQHPNRAHDLTFLRQAVIARLAEEAGYPNLAVDEAFAVFDEVRNNPLLFADVRPALASLKSRFRIVALTNGNADLERIGIADLFDGLINAGSIGVAKPHAKIFKAAIAAGGARAEQTLHVGDDPKSDIQGAHGVGIASVWINRDGMDWPGSLPRASIEVGDLHELDEALQRAASA